MELRQAYEDVGIVILDDLNEEEMSDPRIQAMSKRSRHYNLTTFKNSQKYYEQLEGTIRANGYNYHIFEPNSFRDVENLYQDKTSKDMEPN